MKILAIETSCDETAAAVVEDGRKILANIVASQERIHAPHGGVVPELAARHHVEAMNLIIQKAIDKAGVNFEDLDAVAVTMGPGLPGALLVGIAAAQTMAAVLEIPILGINHLEGHIYANFLMPDFSGQKIFPFIALIVSGGHTSLVLCKSYGKYKVLGSTRDDACGEAFDKVARFLGLGYPGGPVIEKVSAGVKTNLKFPSPEAGQYDFSFSGLKTAVINWVHKNKPVPARIPEVAAAFQKAAIEALVGKTLKAMREKKIKNLVLAGGEVAEWT